MAISPPTTGQLTVRNLSTWPNQPTEVKSHLKRRRVSDAMAESIAVKWLLGQKQNFFLEIVRTPRWTAIMTVCPVKMTHVFELAQNKGADIFLLPFAARFREIS